MNDLDTVPISREDVIHLLGNGLVVSWHSDHGEASYQPEIVRHYVRAAMSGGAQGLRIEGRENIQHVRKETTVPIIGYIRGLYDDGADLITPTMDDVDSLFSAGADIVAIDVTKRKRPDGTDGHSFFDAVRKATSGLLWADCGSFRDGIRAAEAGADFIATTLSGAAPGEYSVGNTGPDYELIHELSLSLTIPIIAEGRILSPDHAARAMAAGAYAVVVGSAITRPALMTALFADCLKDVHEQLHGS